MLRHTFKDKNGLIEATITCKDDTISREDFEDTVNSLMEHLTSHLVMYHLPDIFYQISRMKRKFLSDVLKLLVEVTQACGGKVPRNIRKHLTKGVKSEWDLEEEDNED